MAGLFGSCVGRSVTRPPGSDENRGLSPGSTYGSRQECPLHPDKLWLLVLRGARERFPIANTRCSYRRPPPARLRRQSTCPTARPSPRGRGWRSAPGEVVFDFRASRGFQYSYSPNRILSNLVGYSHECSHRRPSCLPVMDKSSSLAFDIGLNNHKPPNTIHCLLVRPDATAMPGCPQGTPLHFQSSIQPHSELFAPYRVGASLVGALLSAQRRERSHKPKQACATTRKPVSDFLVELIGIEPTTS